MLAPAGEALPDPPDLALATVYDALATPADYLPEDALVCLCDTPRVAERAKHYLWQLGEDVTALLEQGVLPGKAPVFAESFEALCSRLAQGTLLYLDAFLTGGLPVPPAYLLSLPARQLAGYGIRFETLAEDLAQYRKEGFAVVVLTPSRRKAEALLSMLQEGNLHPALDEHLSALPGPGDLTLAVGGLSAGLDFPDGKFAILSASPGPGRPRSGTAAASGWSPSPTWPPGTWWSTSTTASAGSWAW